MCEVRKHYRRSPNSVNCDVTQTRLGRQSLSDYAAIVLALDADRRSLVLTSMMFVLARYMQDLRTDERRSVWSSLRNPDHQLCLGLYFCLQDAVTRLSDDSIATIDG